MLASTPHLFRSYKPYWAQRFGTAPQLPMSLAEMHALGWDSCDIVLVTGDAYVDHPSFGMAVIGRVLEAHGFRVGIIAQPDWQSADAFKKLGKPNLFFGVTAGNMDSMVNRYTSDRKIRSDDAYTPDGQGGSRPDRSVVVYAQRCREAYKDVPVVLGGIEASLRRLAHYDYWSDKVRRSVLMDAKADLLVYGNGERQVVEIAHRAAAGEHPAHMHDIRGTAFIAKQLPAELEQRDARDLPDRFRPVMRKMNPYETMSADCDQSSDQDSAAEQKATPVVFANKLSNRILQILLPSYEAVKKDADLYAHASHVFHKETNPWNANAVVQAHGDQYVYVNPPPIPLQTDEMDQVFDLPYSRVPHSAYGQRNIPAYEMIRFSVNIMRGCFGGCTFCSITEHEGRIIQNRSERSILREIENIRDLTPGFTGNISDLGGPTANMYRLACKDENIEAACRKLSCVYPDICANLNTDHSALIQLYQKARELPGIKRIFIASGLRYDLAVKSKKYVKELVSHHVGGYLKIAPEHTQSGPLSKMMKPGIDSYERFKQLFQQFSKEAGKEQYLIPYFIAAHPGTSDEDMMHLAQWLKSNGFRADQVQTFLPSPMALATAMYHSGRNPLRKVTRDSEAVNSVKGLRQRRLHKAFLRYHDAKNWPMLRKALQEMGFADQIGNSKKHLIPSWQPKDRQQAEGNSKTDNRHGGRKSGQQKSRGKFNTQHTRRY